MPFPQHQTETAPALSTRVFNVLATRFPPERAPAIAGALSEAFPGVPPEGKLRERVQAAILRMTLEVDDGMARALELARIDYRDLLVNAGFEQEDAHIAFLDAAANARVIS
jgi:hypothetical protein